MISTLTMHVRYGRNSRTSENKNNNSWGSYAAAGSEQIPQQWRSIWRSGYDGPWSSGSGSGTKDKSAEQPISSLAALEMELLTAATDKLRRVGRRAKGRYRRALNVSEATQPASAVAHADPPGRRASELTRLDEIDEELADGEERPLIPYKTCPKSAPAILAQQSPSTDVRSETQFRTQTPSRSLSQSYLGLPAQYAKKEAVAERIKSLGRILRRSNSASNSTVAAGFQSGIETPPSESGRRRRLARNEDLHSDSILDSPLYVTASEGSSMGSSPDPSRGIFDPLVKAGTMVAAAELDRLSFMANIKAAEAKLSETGSAPAESQASNPTADVPPNSPASIAASHSGATSPMIPLGGLTPMTPIVPSNTPASTVSSLSMTPLAGIHSYKYSAQKKAARVSRLSEVHLADSDDIAEESASDSGSAIASGASATTGDQDHTDTDSSPVSIDTEQSGDRPDDEVPMLQASRQASPGLNKKHRQRLRQIPTLPQNEAAPAKPSPLKEVDMAQLTELIDKAIDSAVAQQRLTLTKPRTPASKSDEPSHCFDIEALRASVATQLKRADHDVCDRGPSPPGTSVQPLATSRSSSPGGPPRLPGYHKPPTMVTPNIPAVSGVPGPEAPALNVRSGTRNPFSSEDTDGYIHEQCNNDVETPQQEVIRKNTSGTVHVLAVNDSRRESQESTESGDTMRKNSAIHSRA